MADLEIVGFLDPLSIFATMEDAEAWLTAAEKLARDLRSAAVEEWPDGEFAWYTIALSLIEQWYPNIGVPTQRVLAGAVSYRLNHVLDHTQGNA